MKIIASLFFLAAAACTPSTPTPVTPPPPDASDAQSPVVGDCATACATLAAAGCSMGAAQGCSSFLQTMSSSGQVVDKATHRPLTCAAITPATVKTKTDAQNLGFACQ